MKHFFLFLLSAAFYISSVNADLYSEETPTYLPNAELSVEECTFLEEPPRCISPSTAAWLSILFPGLGHAYLGDMPKAGKYMAVTATGIALSVASPEAVALPSRIVTQNAWFYSAYSAYRDGRICLEDRGYCYPMPKEHFTELLCAPFSLAVLKKPEVWGGVLGSLALAVTVAAAADLRCARLDISQDAFPLLAFPIGIGEEAFFRGYLQSEYMERLGPMGGIFLSSLAFSAAHIPNAYLLDSDYRAKYFTYSIPLITALGGYLGWISYKNQSLKECVAVHAWYDFVLFTAAALGNYACNDEMHFSFSFSF
jgi:membrane protease YdiL (CAAX protease family)